MSRLKDWHDQAQAEYQAYFEREIVSTYGRLPLEYAAMFRSVAMMDLPQRAMIRASGPDRLTFLNALVSAELVSRNGVAAAAGTVRPAYLLDRKGRIQAEMRILPTAEEAWIELDARLAEPVVKELEKYRFREQVTLAPAAEMSVVGLFGPAAAKMLSGTLQLNVFSLNHLQGLAAAQYVVLRDDLGDVPAYYLALPTAGLLDTWVRLFESAEKPTAIGWAAFNAARIEAARAMFGVDFDNTFLPAEVGELERYVSFAKGCYPGQEIVARMQSREQCPRRICLVQVGSDALPIAGQPVQTPGGEVIGAVTSSTLSPRRSNAALCLAVLKKPFFEPNTLVRVPAEGAFHEARVI